MDGPFKISISKGKLYLVADVRELVNYLLTPVKRKPKNLDASSQATRDQNTMDQATIDQTRNRLAMAKGSLEE